MLPLLDPVRSLSRMLTRSLSFLCNTQNINLLFYHISLQGL